MDEFKIINQAFEIDIIVEMIVQVHMQFELWSHVQQDKLKL